jgi:thymidylate synthase (FAD)
MKIDIHKGFVRLDGYEATDLSVVNAARVSFGQKKDFMDESDVGLIKFLMKNRHGTPFEHNFFRFHIKTPIFVAREWMRHRIGSFNEFSMRYSVSDSEFYIPEIDHFRTQTGKPGSYTFEPMDDSAGQVGFSQRQVQEVYDFANQTYQQLLAQGVAKEIARIVLPVGTYTEFYWSINARSLMNFVALRNSPEAMLEIREFASAIEYIFSQIMPVTYESFIEFGRVAV